MPSIHLVKKYLRIDGSEDDEVLALLISSAEMDLEDSGVPKSDDPRYDVLVALHTALYSENRDPSIKIEKLNAAYQSLLLKLKVYPTEV